MTATTLCPDVLVIGAGPAGLTAARELASSLPGEVLVLDREAQSGGIPRHSDHTGYGMRDLKRVMTGPAYARRLSLRALDAGAIVRTGAMVTHWLDEHSVQATTPEGLLRIDAKAIVLATGARERPRSARLIPGTRPDGVLTTGQLQNLVHVHHQNVGKRAVVVGGELVSWSAVLTLRGAGARTALMTTQYPRPDAYSAFRLGGKALMREPVATSTRVVRILGRRRVEGVEIEHIPTGQRRIVECDCVVFSGDWIPDHELARSAGLDMDSSSKSPLVDAAQRTSRAGVFAAGNLLHPVDTADIAALGGQHVARGVLDWLGGDRPDAESVRVQVEWPLRWVAPGVLRRGDGPPARGRLLMWVEDYVARPTVVVRQAGSVIGRRRLLWPAAPGRIFRVPFDVLANLSWSAGPITVKIE